MYWNVKIILFCFFINFYKLFINNNIIYKWIQKKEKEKKDEVDDEEKKYERKTYKIKKDIKDKNYNVMIIL